ncbi:MAG: hypothetical protein AAGN35_25225 [Bacteroidota bacterium]
MSVQSNDLLVVVRSDFAYRAELRALLHAACQASERLPVWEEQPTGDRLLPRRLRQYEQTALFIGYQLVVTFGDDPELWPDAETLAELISKHHPAPIRRRRPRFSSAISIFSTVMIVLIPKCPMCFAAYAAALSSLGLGTVPYMPWLLPAMAVVLVLGIAVLWWRGRKGHGYLPFYLSLGGAALLFLGKFTFDSPPLLYAGMGFMLLASIWNALPLNVKTGLRRRIPNWN